MLKLEEPMFFCNNQACRQQQSARWVHARKKGLLADVEHIESAEVVFGLTVGLFLSHGGP